MTKEDVDRLKEVYRRWNESKGASVEDWLNIMSPTIKMKSLGQGKPGMEFTMDISSRDELERYFKGLAEDWEMVHYTPKQFIVGGDRVVMLGRCSWRHRKTGKVIDTPKADFSTFKDGRIVEFYEFYDTAQTLAATQP